MRSQFGPAESASEQALIHARKAEDSHEEARIVDGLCTSLLWGPASVPEAIERCEDMLAWSRGSRVMEANIGISLAGLKGMRGDFEEARALAAAARQTYRELGLRLAVAGPPLTRLIASFATRTLALPRVGCPTRNDVSKRFVNKNPTYAKTKHCLRS